MRVSSGRNRRAFLHSLLVPPGLCLLSWAERARAELSPPPTSYRLANGLRVLLDRDPKRTEIALLVAYDVGRRDDPPGKQGLAHVVEHMTYRGSRHVKPYEALSLLQRAGASEINGFTSPDSTCYFAALPPEALELALWIESERMGFTLERFDQTSLALEREIVGSEALTNSDSSSWRFGAQAQRALFGDAHPYAPPLYPDRDLDEIHLQDVQRCFQQSYRPDNARLILTGNFDLNAATALIERYFGPIRNPAFRLSRAAVALPNVGGPRQFESTAHVLSERFMLSWLLPPSSAQQLSAFDILARVWQRQLSHRLLLKEQVATDVAVTFQALDLASCISIDVQAALSGSAKAISERVLRYVANFWSINFSKDFTLAVGEAALQSATLKERPLALALNHARWLRLTNTPFDVQRNLQALSSLQLKDVYALITPLNAQQAVSGWLLRPRAT